MPKGWVDGEGTVVSVDESYGRGGPIYTVGFTFKVGEHFYGGSFSTPEAYRKDDAVTFTYNPADPDQTSFTREASVQKWVVAGVVVLIVAVWVLVKVL